VRDKVKISYFKFADEKLGYGHTVRDATEEEIEREIKYLNRCLDFDYIGGSGGCDQAIWHDGYYRCAGYQYSFVDCCRVLIKDGWSRGWWTRWAPNRDPELIEKYISEFDPDTEEWVYCDVHYREPKEES
jgi:hypothetical protein